MKAAAQMTTGAFGAGGAQLQKTSRDNSVLMRQQVDELEDANKKLGTIIDKMGNGGFFG